MFLNLQLLEKERKEISVRYQEEEKKSKKRGGLAEARTRNMTKS